MKITFISDTHAKHNQVTSSLPGGDVLIHAGDISNKGYRTEIQDFIKWFSTIENYTHKIFIAGNHDFGCQDEVLAVQELLRLNPGSEYLYDDMFLIGDESADYDDMVKVWGSPWQPEFYNWAFNLPRQGAELKEVWNMIPSDVDILITHGPPYGHLDYVAYSKQNVGCELLRDRIDLIKPKIHVFGHIHSSYGYKFDGTTHFFNAAVLDERYNFTQKPLSVEWDPKTNELNFVE
jgi:Icc-related predicted phosphoesterase